MLAVELFLLHLFHAQMSGVSRWIRLTTGRVDFTAVDRTVRCEG